MLFFMYYVLFDVLYFDTSGYFERVVNGNKELNDSNKFDSKRSRSITDKTKFTDKGN